MTSLPLVRKPLRLCWSEASPLRRIVLSYATCICRCLAPDDNATSAWRIKMAEETRTPSAPTQSSFSALKYPNRQRALRLLPTLVAESRREASPSSLLPDLDSPVPYLDSLAVIAMVAARGLDRGSKLAYPAESARIPRGAPHPLHRSPFDLAETSQAVFP